MGGGGTRWRGGDAGGCGVCRLKHPLRYSDSGAGTDAVTLIQRFGSALNLSVHLHKFNQPTSISPLCGQIFTARS